MRVLIENNYYMKNIFPYFVLLWALIACNSIEEDFSIGTGKTAKVSFNVGGEITTVYENLTRAASNVFYSIYIDEKTSETTVKPYLHGTFSSLDNVNANLFVGKKYLVSIQVDMGDDTTPTNIFDMETSGSSKSYDKSRGFTHYSCDSYMQKDIYYGETTVEISSTTSTTISIETLYCDFGLSFAVTQPLGGTLYVTSNNLEFIYAYSNDGFSSFPNEIKKYTMKRPWAEDEEITISVTYTKNNFYQDVKFIPERNKTVKLNINVNDNTAEM